jgi:hypothetical protein
MRKMSSLRLYAALLGLGVQELAGQALGHRLLAPAAGELDEPADGQRGRAGDGTSTGTW